MRHGPWAKGRLHLKGNISYLPDHRDFSADVREVLLERKLLSKYVLENECGEQVENKL